MYETLPSKERPKPFKTPLWGREAAPKHYVGKVGFLPVCKRIYICCIFLNIQQMRRDTINTNSRNKYTKQ